MDNYASARLERGKRRPCEQLAQSCKSYKIRFCCGTKRFPGDTCCLPDDCDRKSASSPTIAEVNGK